jgi:hypothetical protein
VEDGKPKIVLITDVENGTVMNIGGGSVLVSAEGDYNGDVTFTYTVMDRAGATASANVVLTVNPVNDPPRAKDDAITIDEDATPEISVLANDTDPEGDTLTIDSVSTPAHGHGGHQRHKVLYTQTKTITGRIRSPIRVRRQRRDGERDGAHHDPARQRRADDRQAQLQPGRLDDGRGHDKGVPFVVADAESAVSALIIRITSLDESLVKTSQIALTTDAAGYKTITVTPERNAARHGPCAFQVSDGLLTTTATTTLRSSASTTRRSLRCRGRRSRRTRCFRQAPLPRMRTETT